MGTHEKDSINPLLVSVWQEHLAVDVVDESTSFLACGGDSLTAASMVLDVERRTGLAVPIGQILIGHIDLLSLGRLLRKHLGAFQSRGSCFSIWMFSPKLHGLQLNKICVIVIRV